MALTEQEQKTLDSLQLRYLSSRLSRYGRRSAVRSPELGMPREDAGVAQMKKLTDAVVSAVQAKAEPPVVNVTVEAPEAPVPVKVESPIPVAPKKWMFKHKYDLHGHLTETTATAE